MRIDEPVDARDAALPDVVVGYRIKRADPPIRLVYARLYRLALRIFYGFGSATSTAPASSSAARRSNRVRLESGGAFLSAELLIKVQASGGRVVEVGVPHYPRGPAVRRARIPRSCCARCAISGACDSACGPTATPRFAAASGWSLTKVRDRGLSSPARKLRTEPAGTLGQPLRAQTPKPCGGERFSPGGSPSPPRDPIRRPPTPRRHVSRSTSSELTNSRKTDSFSSSSVSGTTPARSSTARWRRSARRRRMASAIASLGRASISRVSPSSSSTSRREGLVGKVGDDDPPHRHAELGERPREEVVGQRPLGRDALQLHGDRVRLPWTDPDRAGSARAPSP